MSTSRPTSQRRSSHTSFSSSRSGSVTMLEERPSLSCSPDSAFIRQPAILPVSYRHSPSPLPSPTSQKSYFPSPSPPPNTPNTIHPPPPSPSPEFYTADSTPPSPITPSLDDTYFASSPSSTISIDPAFIPILPSRTNGTTLRELKHYTTHPTQAAHALLTSTPTIDKNALKDRVYDASELLTETLLRAFSNFDAAQAVEVFDKMQARMPSFGLPSAYRIGRAVDYASDSVQNLLGKGEKSYPDATDGAGVGASAMDFVWTQQNPVCRALVNQGICRQRDVDACRGNLRWHAELGRELAAFYSREKETYGSNVLMGMVPVWKPRGEKGVWRLYLKEKDGKREENEGREEEMIDTEITFPCSGGWTRGYEYRKGGAATYEDEEWVVVET